MPDRSALPDWPRLMPLPTAASYFGLSPSTFRNLDILPRQIGRRVLYDRADLDRYADRLSGQPLTVTERAAETSEIERRFLERRARRG